ncbi:MAG: transcriptional repressor LexA [Elusimicrobiota bacterium]
MEKIPLTPKQQAIFEFIQSYIDENQIPPSLRDIGKHFDVSVGTVQDQVEAIQRKGYLDKTQTKARSLKLPTLSGFLPILGRVHAGPLHAAIENVEGHVPVGKNLNISHHFALKIKGDSMVDAGIQEGDIVLVRSQRYANAGDIVVAMIEDEATVKRYKVSKEGPYLQPENPKYEPIKDTPFDVVGIVIELRRSFNRS